MINRPLLGSQQQVQPQPTPFSATPLGIAVNTVTGLPKAQLKVTGDILNFGKRILQGIAQSALSAGGSFAKVLDKNTPDTLDIPPVLRPILGTEKISNLSTRIAENELKIKDSPFAKELGLDKHALPLAFAGVIAGTGLDLTPFGSEKNFVRELVKETSEKKILSLLAKSGISEQVGRVIAPRIATATDEGVVRDILHNGSYLQGLSKVTDLSTHIAEQTTPESSLQRLLSAIKDAGTSRKVLEKAQSVELSKRIGAVSGILKQEQGQRGFFRALGKLKGELAPEKKSFTSLISPENLPKEIQPFVQEARKYKSAEEFVKAQGGDKYPTIHEGGVVKMVEGEPIKIVDSIETFLHKGDGGWIVSESSTGRFLSESRSKEGAIAKAHFNIDQIGKDEFLKLIKQNKLTEVPKTVSQLTDIWNKANTQKTTIEPFDVDNLSNAIATSKLSPFEQIHAFVGMQKLLQGQIPQQSQLSLLEDVFGKDLVKAIQQKRPFIAKLADAVTELVNVPRALITFLDQSAVLRQGIIFTVTKPRQSIPAFLKSQTYIFSPKNFQKWFEVLPEHPLYDLMKNSDLYIPNPLKVSGGLSVKEEHFMTNLAQKIPVIGKLIRASERHYVGYLNKLRVDVFSNLANKFIKDGLDPAEDPRTFKALANFVNNATGRGSLGKLSRAGQQLNVLFFSPRLIASRFNMLNPVWYAQQPWPVRKEAIKSFAEFVGIGTVVLALAKVAGADVELDPRSTDFGKIKVGNTRWDIWGGFQQWVRVISQVASGERKTSKGEIQKLTKKKYPFYSRLDVSARFLRGKLAPVPSLIAELLDGQKLFGSTLDIPTEVIQKTIPLYLQDVLQAFDEIGPSAMFSVGLPAFFGVGVQSYGAAIQERSPIGSGGKKSTTTKSLKDRRPL